MSFLYGIKLTQQCFTFDGLKVIDKMNNSVPTKISAGLSVSLRVITNPINHKFINVKPILDDEFEEKKHLTTPLEILN